MNDERAILDHYNLASASPTNWPAEKDDSDASEDDTTNQLSRHYIRRSKSRYSALERHGSDRRNFVPGSEKLPHGQENLVQKDEPDPLGGSDSVVRILRQKGLPVEEDSRLRNRFLLSSTTFSPNLYLSQVHANASNQDLLQGLETLSRSIDSKSASLKVLVESNFERFVRAKTTIDNVYAEMRSQGAEPDTDRMRGHSRIASRESRHFRNVSGQGLTSPGKGTHKAHLNDKKKNALTKESEYGVQGIKAPLIDVAVKSEEIWGPALGGREREGNLKLIMDSVEKAQGIFRVGRAVTECMKRKDYNGVIEEYSKARKYAADAREVAEEAHRNQRQLADHQVHQIVMTGRMWSEVDSRIEEFKRDIWRRLANVQMSSQSPTSQADAEEHLPMISLLLELGVDDNPIWVWLLSRYDYLKNKISTTFERSRVEIEILRRRLANMDAPAPSMTSKHLRFSAGKEVDEKSEDFDSPPVLELWNLIYESLNYLLSTKSGILKEVIEFWDKSQSFIDGKVQKTLPIGFDGRSRRHHRLSAEDIRDLQNGAGELIGMLQKYVFSFFADPPIEDVSMLYSPYPATPVTPLSALSPYAHQDPRFRFDDNNPPPPSPKRGEAWDEFAFWPPYANSLSGVHYLEKLLTLLASAASDMAAMPPASSGQPLTDKLRTMVGSARERALRAASAAWSKDAEVCKYLEDWSRMSERQDLTNMLARFSSFETTILSGMQKILYLPEAANAKPGTISVVPPPPAKLVQMVRSQFVTSLYKALSGMVENAERSRPLEAVNGVAAVEDSITTNGADSDGGGKNRNIRHLLTLSNLKLIQTDTIPHLISQFETHFSITLTDESKQLRDALIQISDRLFLSYTKPTASRLSDIVHVGIAAPDWIPTSSRPSEVRPYVYEALLLLVYTHTEVSTTTPGPLTNQVLSHLLEQMSEAFLDAFRHRDKYYLPALMQATLDMEFVAQTMSQYTTKRASEIQSQIYVVLDEKTTSEASKSLQAELPEMRLVLKKLREGTKTQFLAFRRERGRAVSRAE